MTHVLAQCFPNGDVDDGGRGKGFLTSLVPNFQKQYFTFFTIFYDLVAICRRRPCDLCDLLRFVARELRV